MLQAVVQTSYIKCLSRMYKATVVVVAFSDGPKVRMNTSEFAGIDQIYNKYIFPVVVFANHSSEYIRNRQKNKIVQTYLIFLSEYLYYNQQHLINNSDLFV
ncbi:hypothetical protein ABEB36_007486 [Hypothenemus hampei]|uniref:Uncharacterized protein n=1 Tax=Hypothenemus hampei TaxID=57062 RepID=A0ABD1EUC2_HYPHA